MKKMILLFFVTLTLLNGMAQKHVGIGTTNPLAALHVADSSVLFTGPATLPLNAAPPPVSGAGTRLMWYPDKAAFRAGKVLSTSWDQTNIGQYSFAVGNNTVASGFSSTATGAAANASGAQSTAMGSFSNATGNYSAAIGYETTASGDYSLAMGYQAIANGDYSTAIGLSTSAAGYASTAMGNQATASGNTSIAMGFSATASGDYSTAMGTNASTNNHTNSFCISGTGGTPVANTTDNQMMMRFDNYTFWVSPANFAYLIPASNGWAYTSDKNKKERFEELNGETVLSKISGIPFYSWSFKDPSCRQYRHYGIMAQDFYSAFGRDSYGIIGNDTTVSPLDMLGVDMAAIKALEKRSQLMLKENETLKTTVAQLQDKLVFIEAKLNELLQVKQMKATVK